MNRVACDNNRQRQVKRPCINRCGVMVWKQDECYACRDKSRPKRRQKSANAGTPKAKGKHCSECEGMSWRRPERGKCKCGKRYATEPAPANDVGLVRSCSIFTGPSTRV